MTLANERYRAIQNTREFMRDLLDPKKTPRVPYDIRRRARYALKHFIWDTHLDDICEHCPDILEKPKGDKS